MNIGSIAQVCHETNRAYCAAIGDDSQKEWESAPGWQRESAVSQVEFVRDNPDAGDSAQHDSWAKEKRDAGWTHGEVKDESAKIHPCLVSFEELPPEQRVKDTLFRSVALNMLSAFGMMETK